MRKVAIDDAIRKEGRRKKTIGIQRGNGKVKKNKYKVSPDSTSEIEFPPDSTFEIAFQLIRPLRDTLSEVAFSL